MTKKELRKLYLEKRKSLGEAERANVNLKLYSHFFASVELEFIKVLHCYLPIEKNGEPDTWMIIDRLRREFAHIRISIPRVGPANSLENFYFEGLHQVKPSSLGIPEPSQGIPTPLEKIDMVIVPLLAVDRRGHRVGYGGGFYDRLLLQCRPDCRKLGLSFFDVVDEITDTVSTDIPLNRCITPRGVLDF